MNVLRDKVVYDFVKENIEMIVTNAPKILRDEIPYLIIAALHETFRKPTIWALRKRLS
ncbi:hypothetical protein ACFLRN_05025 [Thermoproteota archaeon]